MQTVSSASPQSAARYVFFIVFMNIRSSSCIHIHHVIQIVRLSASDKEVRSLLMRNVTKEWDVLSHQ